jgi:hypothetical protein
VSKPPEEGAIHLRADWAVVRIAYVPALLLAMLALFLLPAVKLRIGIGLCGCCAFWRQWTHRIEECWSGKPILHYSSVGVRHEDGGDATLIAWADVIHIGFHRRVAP